MFKKFLAVARALFAATAFAAVDVNKASQAELEIVKGIGPAISTQILDERKKGAFKDWSDLVARVKGVGDGNAAKFSGRRPDRQRQGLRRRAGTTKADQGDRRRRPRREGRTAGRAAKAAARQGGAKVVAETPRSKGRRRRKASPTPRPSAPRRRPKAAGASAPKK